MAGGVLVLPRDDDILLSALALGPNGTPISNDLSQAFDGVMIVGSGNLTVKPFGPVGHQSLGFTWDNAERFSLEQDPPNCPTAVGPGVSALGKPRTGSGANPRKLVPEPAGPDPTLEPQEQQLDDELWLRSVFLAARGNPKHGVGIFFAFGASDGNPDPIQYAYLAGIGGKGVMPGRSLDSFGFGVARNQFSSSLVPFLRQQLGPRPAARGCDRDVLQRRDYAVDECYYRSTDRRFQVSIEPSA